MAEGQSDSVQILSKHKHTVGQDVEHIDDLLSQNRRIADSFVLNKCEKEAGRNWDLFYKHHEGEKTEKILPPCASGNMKLTSTSHFRPILQEQELDR
jgi:hypothetical protein